MTPAVTDPGGQEAPEPATTRPLRLGTRRSALAVTQSGQVADRLRALGHDVELVDIVTVGDVSSAPLTSIGGTGVFVSALRSALREGEVDLAVHSLKDLPVAAEPDLVLAAVPAREDPRDVVVAREGLSLAGLPAASRVGTGSPRRAAQLAVARPDLSVMPVRGNVDTRVRLVRSGECDAVVLAAAGLARLGRSDEATDVLDPHVMLPAPGQGALAVECRRSDPEVRRVLSVLDDARTRLCTTAERSLLATLEAGCTAPVGALAQLIRVDRLQLTGFAGTPDGGWFVRRTLGGVSSEPEALGRRLAEEMLAAGADRLGTAP